MYSSQISSILVPIHRCLDLLGLTTPVPPSLTLVAPVIASLVPPNPIVDSLAYATPSTPTPVLNTYLSTQCSLPSTLLVVPRCTRL